MKWIARIVVALALLAVLAGAALYLIPAVQDRVIATIIDNAFSRKTDDLAKDDALRVAICGSGSPMPDPDRAPACNLVFAGGHLFLVDVGAGSWSRAARWNLPLDKTVAVFLTHFHSDHIGDLGEVDLQTWVGHRPAPLLVYGGPGIERVVGGFNEAYAMDHKHRVDHHGPQFLRPELGDMVPRLIAAPDGAALKGQESAIVYDQDGVKITAFAVNHDPIAPAYGYRFDFKGRAVVFSGDTVKTESIAVNGKGADVLIHEAMLKDVVAEMEVAANKYGRTVFAKIMHDIPGYHSSPRDAAEIAAEGGIPHLVLSHVIPPLPYWLGERVFLRDTDIAGVDAHLAFDGMLITMPAGSKDVIFGDLGR